MATYLVTGVSSGIGLDIVKQLAARGDKVYGTCRSRASSASKEDLISAVQGDVTVIEGVDVTSDSVGEVLKKALEGVTLDAVIHNAGSINGAAGGGEGVFAEQALEAVSMDRMRAAFEVNTLGPLRVQQAVTPFLRSPGGKVAIVSTGFASIQDTTSGGTYAYRASKAAVNMIGKCMSCDLGKDGRGISVVLVAPGFVATEFGPGKEKMEKMGAAPVDQASGGVIKCLDDLTLEGTGKFWMVRTKDGGLEEFPW